ncbi:MAG: hypothetical protein KDA61_16510, partial [Planctomycetales bacterium]|nr:hypothetical protein [Planctomycetales bacterium]
MSRNLRKPRLESLEERRLLSVAPRLVLDRADELYGGNSDPTDFTQVGEQLFFVAGEPATGRELWKTNGSSAGTQLVRDVLRGAESSEPRELVDAGGTLFFVAANQEGDSRLLHNELWKSDGTESGTQLVRAFPPRDSHFGYLVEHLTVLGSTVIFTAGDVAGGQELWRSDGTAAGTYPLTDLSPPDGFVEIANFASQGEYAYFWVDGRRLWKTDGTHAGTQEVVDLGPDFFLHNWGARQQPTISGELLYFGGFQGSTGVELWVSDGTTSGTRMINEVIPGPEPGSSRDEFENLTAFDGGVYFTLPGVDDLVDLWTSDGSSGGTYKVADLPLYEANTLTLWYDKVFFWGSQESNAFQLWQSDGSGAGTERVGSLISRTPVELTPTSSSLLFEVDGGSDDGMWRTDGTAAGTIRFASHPLDGKPGGERGLLHDVLYVALTDASYGYPGVKGLELWSTDGTGDGTRLVKDIYVRTADSNPHVLAAHHEAVVVGYRQIVASGPEFGLWQTNGTANATFEYTGAPPGLQTTFEAATWEAEFVDETLFFLGPDAGIGHELWKSIGSEGQTLLVKDIRPGSIGSEPAELTNVSGTLFFTATGGVEGRQLWKSDGTEAGTMLVKSISENGSTDPNIRNLTSAGGRLFFTAKQSSTGVELWTSDGTEAGTTLVKDALQGSESSQPMSFTPIGDRLFFTAIDGGGDRELWVSDGTDAGTYRVKDILPGSQGSSPHDLVEVGGLLYFIASDGTHGTELWRSDGTESGTFLVKDIFAGLASSGPTDLVNVGGSLYFTAVAQGGMRAIWRSDGTEAGTEQVTEPGDVAIVSPSDLISAAGTLYFLAGESYARQVWSSDGTHAGTLQVTNFAFGDGVDYPHGLIGAGGKAYFRADDGYSGEELWVLDEAQPGDFDADGDADGADFLLWQRTFGRLPLAPGVGADADADDDVDASDRTAWESAFGLPDFEPAAL